MKQTMYVDVLWILISDRGSTPRTSTRLRFEFTCLWQAKRKRKPASAKSLQRRSRAKRLDDICSKLRPGEPIEVKQESKMHYYVYSLQSINFSENHYTGFTPGIKKGIVKHNNRKVSHTSKFKPWIIKNVISFTNKEKALAFEKYLKSHSGRAFAKKHF